MFHDKLLKLSNPDIYKEFKKGCLSLKRTSKPFSRTPIYLTLEQTIKADPAYQCSNIVSLTNSISAQQRSAQNHSIHTSIFSKLFEELGMASKENISEGLKLRWVKLNCHHLKKIISSIYDSMNPFASTIKKKHLFNIANGKAALDKTADFLNKITKCQKQKPRVSINDPRSLWKHLVPCLASRGWHGANT